MRKKIVWTGQAKTDLRAVDQATALHTLHIVARYLATARSTEAVKVLLFGPGQTR